MKFRTSAFLVTLILPSIAVAQVGLGNDESAFGRTILVHATGSDSDNGAALFAALTSDMVTTRIDPSTERVVLQLGPGRFDVKAFSPIVMPDYVDLRGSGERTTYLHNSALSAGTFDCIGTVNRFSHLTVSAQNEALEASDGAIVDVVDTYLTAQIPVYVSGSGTRMSIEQSGVAGFFDAIHMRGSATLTIEYSSISAFDEIGNGAITGASDGGNPVLRVSYSHMNIDGNPLGGGGGVMSPWPGGNAHCAFITTRSALSPMSEAVGCPAP